MIIEKIINALFSYGGFLSGINIDLPSNAYSAVRTLINNFSVLDQLIDVGQVVGWTVLVILFQMHLSIMCFLVKIFRG